MSPEQIAADIFSVDPNQLVATRIKDGLTNDSYLVTGAKYRVVVRISNANDKALQIDRNSEAIVLKLVEDAGIGAPTLFNAPEKHILVTAEIPGRNLARMDLRDEKNIIRVATLLRRLHSLAVPASVQATKLEHTLRGYWRLLGEWRDHAVALEIAHDSDAQSTRCLCHNDIHHMNLIDDGDRLWLLDWEYAGVGDPYFDLASVCCYHDFSQTQRTLLLESYISTKPISAPVEREDVVEMDTERLNRMCWLFDYIKELWFEARRLG